MVVSLLILLALQCFKVCLNSIMMLALHNVDPAYDEFYRRIRYNFRLHLLLCLNEGHWERQNILQRIFKLEGYHQHKVVKYYDHWVHIHIKFNEERQTERAVEYFKNVSSRLTAVSVDDLLRDWSGFEARSKISPLWTLAVVDVLGTTPKSLNVLTPNLLNYILNDFGQPYLSPYTAALKKPHVQIMFSSMTEALAACMALGNWYKFNKRDDFVYRVRINPAKKESLLISRSGGKPDDTFKLGYFIHPKLEAGSADFKFNSMGNCRIPVMCIPVLLNWTQPQTSVVPDKQQIHENCFHTLLSHYACIETPEPGTRAETSDPEMQVYSSSHIYTSAEASPGWSHQSQHVMRQERLLMNRTRTFNIPRQVSMPNTSHLPTEEREQTYRGKSVVFERSKS